VNLLSDPNLWQSTQDGAGFLPWFVPNYAGPPPEWWDANEQAYLFLDNPSNGRTTYSGDFRMRLAAGAFVSGDTIEGTFTALNANGSNEQRVLRLYNELGQPLQSIPLGDSSNVGVPIPFSFPAGELYSIGPSSIDAAAIYGGQFRINAVSPPPCELLARDDNATVTAPGLVIASVYANDDVCPGYEGQLLTTLPPELSFDTETGAVTLLPGADAGIYQFEYEIALFGGEGGMSAATVTVTYAPPTNICYPPVCGCTLPACNGV
jgi:hypothetical protein